MPLSRSYSRVATALAAGAAATALVTAGLATPGASAQSPQTAWRAAGARPLPDGEAAARVRSSGELRPANAEPNRYRPTPDELDRFRHGQRDRYGRTAVAYNPLAARVTGAFSGTTDEILQWVAHKWGIPEDVVRAVAVTESWWRMSQLGDRAWAADPARHPWHVRVPGTRDVFRSLGLMQVKWTPEGLHQGTEPLRWKSTAFNADYWGAVVRYHFDGRCDWCGPGYGRGQGWASIGAWYSPSPWGSSTHYLGTVRRHAEARTWTELPFRMWP